ncbi:MAG TPA: Rid family detoxifying hydrolase [Gemmatimonadales bacterium]
MRTLFGVALLALAIGTASAQERTVIRMPGSLEGLPFSSAVRVGNLIFLSGQIGLVPGTRTLAEGGAAGQTRQAMENIKAVVEYAGSSMNRMVKCTVFLRHIEDYAEVNEVYASFFRTEPPARSAMAASGLALDALVEIECIALVGAAR